ncbi:hypothetical protein [uncultured Gimesia sp.]|uniref:hypothetical protein n=1 Tax=uncultured Gimesia sp. TaxID=1678688 RepID=UPI002628A839|nr:hypothetical protein [uncultured Gimesia sp.]
MNTATLFLLSLTVAGSPVEEWPEGYTELDGLLSSHSAQYKKMADYVRKRHSYRIASTNEFPLGNVKDQTGKRGLVIELNPKMPKERRATILIWEMANAYQREAFAEVTRRARSGKIDNHREYGIRMELVEHGSHQLHRDVLVELSRAGIPIAEDFLYFLNPKLKSLETYRIPTAHDYIEAQSKSGHTKHYEKWFYLIREKKPPADF